MSHNPKLSSLYCDFTITSSNNAYDFNLTKFMKAYNLDVIIDNIHSFEAWEGFSRIIAALNDNYNEHTDYEIASMYTSQDEVIMHFPNPSAMTLSFIAFSYTNSSEEDVEVTVYPYQTLITTTSLTEGYIGAPYGLQLTAKGNDPITWTITSGDVPGLSLSTSGYLSGTPTTAGTYSITIRAANSSSGYDSATFTLTVSKPPLHLGNPPSITTMSLTEGYTGAPYGFQLKSIGTSPITWTITDGNIPGLSLSTSGYLSGTPTTAGTYSITIKAANSAGSDSATLSLNVSAPLSGTGPSIATSTIDNASSGKAYAFQLAASGTPPFTWTVKGKLPDGLSLSSSGRITGTPSKKGKKSFTVTAKNNFGTDSKKLTLIVNEPPSVATETLKEATVGKKYNVSFKAKGTKPMTWTLDGDLPDGLTFDTSKGKLSGTPTINGSYTIRVTLRSSESESFKLYTLKVNAILPVISTKKLKDGKYGKAYKLQIKTKGTKPITLDLTGTLPEGLSFNEEAGTITGTPTESCNNRGLSLTASNMGGSVTQNYSLTIKAIAPKITTKSLPNATAGTPYNTDLTATGSPTITWSASGLPSGLSMSASGTISGTPSASGKFNVSVTAKNDAKSVTKKFKFNVSAANTSTARNKETESPALTRNESAVDYLDAYDVEEKDVVVGYVIVAELPEVSVDVSGMYDFEVVLDENVPVDAKLLWLSGSSEPSNDDDIAEFCDESGEEIDTVPENRKLGVSAWLNPGRVYRPAIAVIR